MISFFKNKRLGVAEEERRYDLPLNKDESGGFLVLLIALMTFLAVMALAASFALNSMAARWTSGLENQLTIEIPAESGQGELRSAADIEALETKIATVLSANDHIKSFAVMKKEDIAALLEPWLGGGELPDSMPLPGMITVELKSSEPFILKNLTRDIKAINADINVDAHESWLRDLLRLTGALQWAAFAIAALIGFTTVTAVAGGARSRMAIYAKDVELLHLMGASDEYVTRQFQRHTMILGLKGGALGTAAALLALAALSAFSGEAQGTLPDFALHSLQFAALMATPLAAGFIAAMTARFTVLRSLARMP